MRHLTIAAVLICQAGSGIAETMPEVDPAMTGGAGLFPYLDATRVAEGKALYADTCAACHGAAMEGQADWRSRNADGGFRAPPHDASGHTWHHPDAQLFAITKYGTEKATGGAMVSDMAGFGEVLNDAEILSVLAFIKANWPDRIIARHNALNQSYEAQQ